VTISRFAFPTTIHFGVGARALVADHLREHGIRRPLIVSDKGLAALPVLADFGAGLKGLAVDIYTGASSAIRRARRSKAGRRLSQAPAPIAVIGFGGGAALDVAKTVALMAVHEGDVLEYAWDHPKVRPITQPLPYFIALPTTSGTGSEVGRSSVISDDRTHVKKIVFSPALLAKAVFADPELTVDLPPGVTAATGMDALTHNVESYLSPAYHPLCDGIALEGARIAAHALETAVKDPKNLAARSDMMMASLMGAIAFQKDLGAVHSCAHALGTVVDMHHGLANGIMIDHVMRFNRDAAETKMAELARVCGAGNDASDFIDWLGALKERIGIPARLGGKGVTEADIPKLVEIAVKDTCHQTNPRACSAEDFRASSPLPSESEVPLEATAAFTGTIPEFYDRNLGPAWFDRFAEDLAARLPRKPAGDVLEIACGTGLVTKWLRARLDPAVRLVATDLNEPMLDYARKKYASLSGIDWKPADALALPFADATFGAAACGFGIMFVPDPPKAMREIRRVLEPGAPFVFNVWDRFEENPRRWRTRKSSRRCTPRCASGRRSRCTTRRACAPSSPAPDSARRASRRSACASTASPRATSRSGNSAARRASGSSSRAARTSTS
jgi:alcohol dehydrogenase class IV/ubiquinone/menaquinone biosynthesis C-methylase UbiE